MAQSQIEKVLVRTSDGRAEDYFGVQGDPPTWVAPSVWDARLAAGYTAEDIPLPKPNSLFDPDGSGVYIKKIVDDAWVDRTQGEIDTDKLVVSKGLRNAAVCRLKEQRSGAQLAADDTNLVQAMRDAAAADVTAFDADVTSHSDNYEAIWVDGTNP